MKKKQTEKTPEKPSMYYSITAEPDGKWRACLCSPGTYFTDTHKIGKGHAASQEEAETMAEAAVVTHKAERRRKAEFRANTRTKEIPY